MQTLLPGVDILYHRFVCTIIVMPVFSVWHRSFCILWFLEFSSTVQFLKIHKTRNELTISVVYTGIWGQFVDGLFASFRHHSTFIIVFHYNQQHHLIVIIVLRSRRCLSGFFFIWFREWIISIFMSFHLSHTHAQFFFIYFACVIYLCLLLSYVVCWTVCVKIFFSSFFLVSELCTFSGCARCAYTHREIEKEVPLNPATHISIANFLLFTILFYSSLWWRWWYFYYFSHLHPPPWSTKTTPNWVVANGKYTKEDERHEGGMNEVKTIQIFLFFSRSAFFLLCRQWYWMQLSFH